MSLPAPCDDTTFFEYGSVTLGEWDRKTRQAVVRIRLPYCLLQAVTPALLGGGSVDELRVAEPMMVWIPRLTGDRVSAIGATVEGAHELINRSLKERAEESLRAFMGLSPFVRDPTDLVPFLPMGTYVTLRLRIRIDSVLQVVEALEGAKGVCGVAEFQAALAAVLHEALVCFGGLSRPGT